MEDLQVSLIIPCYNVAEYVSEGIKSIINQTYKNLEIICLDDASTDDTYEILLKLKLHDTRIVLYRNEYNLGLIKTLNKLVKLATNDTLIRMDPDDIVVDYRICKLVNKYLETKADIVSSDYSLIDQFGNEIKKRGFDLLKTPMGIKYTSYFNSPIPHAPALIRRELLIDNPFIEDYKAAEDYKLWSTLLRKKDFKVEILNESLYYYRQNPTGMSFSNSKIQSENHIRIAKENVSEELGINSAKMYIWNFSKSCYNGEMSFYKITEALDEIGLINRKFLTLFNLNRYENEEVKLYTAQYLFYTYYSIIRQSYNPKNIAISFFAILYNTFKNLNFIISIKLAKWILKRI